MPFQPVLNINNTWLKKIRGQVSWKITNNRRQRKQHDAVVSMLLIFGGLPGTGKSTLARLLAASLTLDTSVLTAEEAVERIRQHIQSGGLARR